MAKAKEMLTWITLNAETLPQSLQVKHAAIRKAFEELKVLKTAFETECDAILVKNAAKLPEAAQEGLRVERFGKDNAEARFPAGTVRKFSYMRGIAVATAQAAKAKSAGGVSLA